MEPQRTGDSFDTSQADLFATAKGLLEINGSPALVSTTGQLILVIIKLLVYGDCRGLSLFNDNHLPSKRQPSIFKAVSYCSAVCP